MNLIKSRKPVAALTILLVIPAAYFLCISILKFELGVDGPYDASEPMLISLGLRESLGWNINLLIAIGPPLALLLSVMQVLHIEWTRSTDYFYFAFTVKKKWFPISIAILSALVMAVLSLYLFVENCK
jgi:hypothetical protein